MEKTQRGTAELPAAAEGNGANDRMAGRAVGALLAYVFSKASVFVAPVALSAIFPLAQYGLFEFTLSVAQLTSVALAAGIHAGVPYFLLKRRRDAYLPAFLLHRACVAVTCLAASLIAATMGQGAARLISLMAGIIVTQYIEAARHRTAGRPREASLVEGGLYALILSFAAAAWLHTGFRHIEALADFLTLCMLGIASWSLWRFPWSTPRLRLWRVYRGAVRYGVGVLPASLANVGLVSSGRILIGAAGSFDEVALYSIAYRLSSPLVAVHQFLTGFWFRSLYESSVRSFERYFLRLSGLLFAAAAVIVFVAPKLGGRIIGAQAPVLSGRTDLFVLMSLVMVFWAQLSLMELFINRESRSLRQLPGMIAGCLISAVALLWHGHTDAADTIAFFQGLGLAVAVMWQFRASGVPKPGWRVARTLIFGQAIALILAWVLSVTR